jgi:hypothetical protein
VFTGHEKKMEGGEKNQSELCGGIPNTDLIKVIQNIFTLFTFQGQI